MNRRIVLSLIFSILMPFYSYAQETNTLPSIKEIQENMQLLNQKREGINIKWGKFFEENGKLENLFRADLGEKDINKIQTIINDYNSEKNDREKEGVEVSKNGGDTGNGENHLIELKLSVYKKLIPYIEIDKKDEYVQFIRGNIEILRDNKDLRDALYKQQGYLDKRVESLKEKISENKKTLDDKIQLVIEEKIDEKIKAILNNSEFTKTPYDTKIIIFKKILEKIQSRKSILIEVKDKTTILDKKIEIFELFERKIREVMENIQNK